MNTTIDRILYHLRPNVDQESICFEAQQNGGELETGRGKVTVCIWENNPYASFFAIKHFRAFYAVERESWYI